MAGVRVRENIPLSPSKQASNSIYSNFDHALDEKVVKFLEENNDTCASHAAWNYIGYVWTDGEKWYEEVWYYKAVIAVYSGDTLMEVIEEVISYHGRD